MHCFCTVVPRQIPRPGGGSRGTLCPGETRPRDSGGLLLQHIRHGGSGAVRAPPEWHRRGTVSGQAPVVGRQDLAWSGVSLDRQSLRKPSPVRAAFEKALKAKETGWCQRQRSPGIRDHCFCKEADSLVRAGGPSGPRGQSQALLTSSHCWRWCWPRRRCPVRRAAGRSSLGCPPQPPASRGGQRSGPARAAPRAAGTDTTE